MTIRTTGRTIYYKFPFLRPPLAFLKEHFFSKPTFSGWGMTTTRELPWNDEYQNDVFRKAASDVKKFEFSKHEFSLNSNNVDSLLWRHWIVSFSVRYAIEFSDKKNLNFVECGVGDGLSAFFALREIGNNTKIIGKWSMHLFDSWEQMKQGQLLHDELPTAGRYSTLNIDITRRNLSEFHDNIIYYQGYIPETFHTFPESPNSIVYLHVDLNAAKPTLDTLKFFFTRLQRGGVILFDDYGSKNYGDTKKIIDSFFSDKPGILMKLPTGQAIFYR